MLTVLTVDEAQRKVLDSISSLVNSEKIKLDQALGRVTAEVVFSPEALPPFNRSTMDGFAVRAVDTFGATDSMPAFLTLTGEVLMGKDALYLLGEGNTVSVPTGGMLPQGADAVVMLEYAEELAPGELAVYRPVAPGENILRRGEDCEPGDELLVTGKKLRPQDLGVLAALGIADVTVYSCPRVAIISTGDELVPPDQIPVLGQIRDINSTVLSAQVEQAGGEVCFSGIIHDSQESLKEALEKALALSDLVLISGGSSVGMRDLTTGVIDDLADGGVLFHGVAMRPGKPMIFGCAAGKPVFGLSGNPVSAMIGFSFFVRPVLNKIQGLPPLEEYPKAVEAKLSRSLSSTSGREDFVRVELVREGKGSLIARPLFGQAGLMRTMIKGEGLLRIEQNQEGCEEGETVRVYLFD